MEAIHGGKKRISQKAGFKFFYDSGTPHRVYAFSEKLLVLTSQGWQEYPEPPCPGNISCDAISIAVVPNRENELYVLQFRYIDHNQSQTLKLCATINNGTDWTVSDWPFSRENSYSLFVSATEPRFLVVYDRSGGSYIKNRTWRSANEGFENRFGGLALEASHHNLYAYRDSLLYRSRNEGRSWSELRFRLPKGYLTRLAIDPHDPEHLIIQMARTTLKDYNAFVEYYSSKNGGDSWRFLFRLHVEHRYEDVIAFDPHHSGTIFFAAGRRILKSTKGGIHPQPLHLNLAGVQQIYFDPEIPDRIFFINGDVYQSNDGGKTAYFSGSDLPVSDEGAQAAVYITSAGNGEYLVENDFAEFFQSTNQGRNWKPFSHIAFRGYHVSGAGPTYSADKQKTHFFTLSKGRLFESTEAGRYWKRVNWEKPREKWYGDISDITDPLRGPLYASSYTGIWKAVVAVTR